MTVINVRINLEGNIWNSPLVILHGHCDVHNENNLKYHSQLRALYCTYQDEEYTTPTELLKAHSMSDGKYNTKVIPNKINVIRYRTCVDIILLNVLHQ